MNGLNQEDLESSVFKERPIQLIDFKEGGFVLNEEALKLISEIKEDIVVVSVVGKARTGKSYLMNLLLGNNGKESGVRMILLVRCGFVNSIMYERNLDMGKCKKKSE